MKMLGKKLLGAKNNDSHLRMGASAFLKSVDFTAFLVNVKTIAPTQNLYQFGHAIWCGRSGELFNFSSYPIAKI